VARVRFMGEVLRNWLLEEMGRVLFDLLTEFGVAPVFCKY